MQKLIESDIKMVRIIEDEFLKHCSTIVKQNINNQSIVNSVKKSQDKFFYVKKIILKAHKENITYRKCLDIDYKKRKKSMTLAKSKKSTFYALINELRKIWYFAKCHKKWHPAIGVFDKIINNPPIPKKPRIKYNSSQRKEITDLYFSQNKIALNKTNVWLKLKKNNDDYKNLSLRTVCNYIANDERNINYDKRAKIKHGLRKWNIDIGNIQLDVKVIGPKETKFRKYIFIMDAKDEQSKIYWCKVLRHQTKQEMIDGLFGMINFYKRYSWKKRFRVQKIPRALC